MPDNETKTPPNTDDTNGLGPVLERLDTLTTDLENLRKENTELKTQLGNLSGVVTRLYNQPITHTDTPSDAEAKLRHEKFIKFLKGE